MFLRDLNCFQWQPENQLDISDYDNLRVHPYDEPSRELGGLCILIIDNLGGC